MLRVQAERKTRSTGSNSCARLASIWSLF